MTEDYSGQRVIRRVRVAHCKLGPVQCEDCREDLTRAICLLALYPPGSGLMQRRAIEVTLEGQAVWREFEIVRRFANEAEARCYASEHGIDDVEV